MTSVLEVEDVVCGYGGYTAVDGATFSIRDRSTVGIVGPNGAGKTTMLNAISGLVRVQRGRISALGRDITADPPHRRARLGIARSFQTIQLFPDLTVLENVELGLYTRQTTTLAGDVVRSARQRREARTARRESEEMLDLVGLGGLGNRSARELSFGQGRRVELSRVLVARPSLLLLDEPTTGVDAHQVGALARTIRTIRESIDVTIVIVEHNLTFVRELCDEIVVMSLGRTIAQGPVDKTLRDRDVVEAYLGGKVR